MRKLLLALMLMAGFSGAAEAGTVNFTLTGTNSNGETASLIYHGVTPAVSGGFTVFQFLNNASCTTSLGNCLHATFMPGANLLPNPFPANLAGRVNIVYSLSDPFAFDFWFPLNSQTTAGTYATIPESPGTGTLTVAFDPNGMDDGGLTRGVDDLSAVPEPSSLMLLAVGLAGMAWKKRQSLQGERR